MPWSFFSVQPLTLVITGCHIKYTFHQNHNPIKKWLIVVAQNKGRRYFKNDNFSFFLANSWSPHLSSFFTIPNCFKFQMMVKRSILSHLATSHVIRGSASMMLSVGRCQLLMTGHYSPYLKALVSFAKLLEPPLHCMFISSSWAKCVVDVASCLRCFTTHFELE